MKNPRVTIDDVLAWEPCAKYTHERVKAIFGRKKYLTAADIARLKILPEDKVWALCHAPFMARRTAVAFAVIRAESVLSVYKTACPGDGRVENCLRVARRWLRGEGTQQQLRAAYAAAFVAASAASAYAAYASAASAYAAYAAYAADAAYAAAYAAANWAAAYADAAGNREGSLRLAVEIIAAGEEAAVAMALNK